MRPTIRYFRGLQSRTRKAYNLNPKDPIRRFIAVSSEVEAMFETMTGENYGRDPKEKKKAKKPEKKGYKFKEDPGEDLGDRHVANADDAVFYDADPLTEEDLAKLAKLKKMLNIE